MDSNHGPGVSVATALPTESQPLPKAATDLCHWMILIKNISGGLLRASSPAYRSSSRKVPRCRENTSQDQRGWSRQTGLLTCFQHNLSISSFSTLYSIGLADISAISHVESWVVVIFNYSNEIFQTGNKQYCGHHKFISVHNSNMSGMSPSTYCIICWASMSLHLLLLMSSTFDQ